MDSGFEFKCLNLYKNDHFKGLIIDIGSSKNRLHVAISSRQCLAVYNFYI